MIDTDFEAFYRSEYESCVRLAFLLCGSQPTAEDLVQDTFINLSRHFGSVTNPSAYIRRSLVHAAASFHRRELRRAERLHRLYEPPVLDAPDREMLESLSTLPMSQRTVLVLRYWCDMSLVEISEVVGCGLGTTKSRLSRGVARMRSVLEDHQ